MKTKLYIQERRFRHVCTLQNTYRPHVIKTIKRHYVHIWMFSARTFWARKKWLQFVKKGSDSQARAMAILFLRRTGTNTFDSPSKWIHRTWIPLFLSRIFFLLPFGFLIRLSDPAKRLSIRSVCGLLLVPGVDSTFWVWLWRLSSSRTAYLVTASLLMHYEDEHEEH